MGWAAMTKRQLELRFDKPPPRVPWSGPTKVARKDLPVRAEPATHRIIEQRSTMAGYYQIKKADKGALSFTLKEGNHEGVLVSPVHPSDADLRSAIEQVRKNSQRAERFKRLMAKDKSPYFTLTNEQGQVLGSSEMYSSALAMEQGIRSVMSNGATSVIKEAS
jgi:uncharacterized protein